MDTPVKKVQLPQKLQKLMQPLGKYKYAAAVLLLGVVLMLWPQEQSTLQAQPTASETEQTLSQVQEQLQSLLCNIDGAGHVQVMLSLQTGTEYEYQSDMETDRKQTVFAQEAGNVKTPVVRMSHYPVYRGAVVVCEGANSTEVRLRIVDAVCSLTGLGSDKVSVIKMKKQ